jgi:hypothetical protein
MDRTAFVFAPQGSGKTRHAEQLCVQLGCMGIVDDWWPGQPIKPDHLHLSNDMRAVVLDAAIAAAETGSRVDAF